MTSKEKLTIEQLEYYRNTYEKYDGIESNIFEQICNELIDFKKSKTSTLSECIKEWEERGYRCVFSNEDSLLEIFNDEDDSVIKIGIKNKHYIKVDSIIYAFFESITFEEHFLLTKTLKALEVEDEKEN